MTVQPGFIFGGDTGVQTPEELARLRAIADALRGPVAPKTVGQGLSAIGEALGYRMANGRANKAEADWRKGGDSVFSALFGSGAGSTPAGAGGAPTADSGSVPASGTLPNVDVSKTVSGGVDPGSIFAGLKSRGLNDAQAYATLGNWKQESEFRPGAVNPGEGAVGFTQWREGRKTSLENFAKATGRTASDPEAQMDFYVREAGIVPDTTGTVRVDPGGSAFAKATDIEGANRALKGFIRYGSPYDKGGEGTRLANALAYQKQGFAMPDDAAPRQVASLDPSAGLTPAPGGGVAAALAGSSPAPVQPQTAAQALSGTLAQRVGVQSPRIPLNTGAAPASQSGGVQVAGGGPTVQLLMQAATDPRLSAEQRGVVSLLLKKKMDEADPATQMEMEKNRLEMEKTRIETERLHNPQMTPAEKARLDFDERKLQADQNKLVEVGGSLVDPKTHQAVYTGQQTDWEKLDDNTLYNKRTGESKAIGRGPNAGQFRFKGSSVEAQSLNGLMDTGDLTEEQAQQLGAGKTITGPNGEMLFLTPQGVFGQAGKDAPAVPVGPRSAPQAPAAPQAAPASQATPPAAAPAVPSAPASTPAAPVSPRAANPAPDQNAGIMPLTGPKTKAPNEQQQRDAKLYSVVAPELKIVEDNFSALSNLSDQALSAVPHGSDYGADYLKSPDYQRASNSLKTIIASYLYSVSGATAAPAEVENQASILTPKPGEAKESVNDKLARVRAMVDAIRNSRGAGDAPPAEPTGTGTTSNGLKWSIEP